MERYRIGPDGDLYYITMTVIDWLPIFVSEQAYQIVTESLNFSQETKGLRVHAYVIMPTHLHAIVFQDRPDPDRLKKTLWDFRKFTGRQLLDLVRERMPNCFLAPLAARPGDDRPQFWQPTIHPVLIESESFCDVKRQYLHENPCRKGLVRRGQDWRYSSASYWMSDRPEPNDVRLSAIEW